MCSSPRGHKKSGNDLATKTTARQGRYLKIHFDIILFSQCKKER